MAIGSSHYQLGSRFSLAEMIARSNYNSVKNNPLAKALFSGESLRSLTRHDDAYQLLLSPDARRTVTQARQENVKTEGEKLLESLTKKQYGTKAAEYGITGDHFDYLKETLPDSSLVKQKYSPVVRASAAMAVQNLYKRLDEGLSKVDVDPSSQSGLELSTGDLPSWLKFDANSGSFFGNPPAGFSGEVDVLLRLSLDNGETAEDTITLAFSKDDPNNHNPYLTGNLQYLTDAKTGQAIGSAITGSSYRVTIPANLFNENDPGDELQFEARVKSEGDLQEETGTSSKSLASKQSEWPSWLVFHRQLRVFEGVPPASEAGKSYEFVVTARDKAGAEVSSVFRLKIASGEDSDAENVGALQNQVATTTQPFVYVKKFDDVFKSLDGSYQVNAKLKNGNALPSWLKFAVDTIDPPKIRKPINPQAMIENKGFSHKIELDELIEDKGQDRYEIKATYSVAGGVAQALPSWLEFDEKSNILRATDGGTPVVGDYTIHLEIEDVDDGYTVATSFDFKVNAARSNKTEPKLENHLVSKFFPRSLLTVPATGSDPNEIPLPEHMFGVPPAGSSHAYTLTLRNGSPLPSWLSLDPSGNGKITKSVAPSSASGEKFELTLTAKDAITGFSDTHDFFIEILPEDVTVVSVPTPRTMYIGSVGEVIALPGGTFSYDKPSELVYSAKMASGAILPSWLTFDDESQSFRFDQTVLDGMNAKPYGDYQVVVRARDPSNGKENTVTVSIAVRNVLDVKEKPTALSGEINPRIRNDGSIQRFSLGEGLFSENLKGENYTYKLLSKDGSALPSWLTFDASTFELRGTPPVGTAEQDLELLFFAQDPRGEAAYVNVKLSVMSRDTDIRLKLYGTPSAQQSVGSFDILFTAGKGEGKAESLMTLSLTKNGGSPTLTPSVVTTLPNLSAEQNNEYFKKLKISDYFTSSLYDSKYSVRQRNGVPLPSWLTFEISRDQVPLIKKTLPSVGLVESDTLKFEQSVLPSLYVSDEKTDDITVSAKLSSGAALPSWLEFDEDSKTLKITDPTSATAGRYTVRYTFKDETDDHQVILDQEINIHATGTDLTPPKTPLTSFNEHKLKANIGEKVDLDTEKLFGTAKSGDNFVYNLRNFDGEPIPSWLSFDPNNPDEIKITGTPPVESSKKINLVLSATNSQGIEKRTSLSITAFKEGHLFSRDKHSVAFYSDEKDQKVDVNGYIHQASLPKNLSEMTFSANLQGGAALPSWLVFDDDKRTLKVDKDNIPTGTTGLQQVEITLSDGAGIRDTFLIDVNLHDPADKKDPPEILYGMTRRSLEVDVAASFTLPADMFTPPLAGEAHTFEVAQVNGDPLPSWLRYDAVTKTFSGTPPASTSLRESLKIAVVVTDQRGAITVATVPILFTDRPEDPHFVFKGKPTSQDDVGNFDLELNLTDIYGASVSSQFSLNVRDVVVNPKVDDPIATKSLAKREKLELDLSKRFSNPENADVDDHDLTYTLTMQDGSVLPSWLTVDNAKHQFTADIPDSASGDYKLRLKIDSPGGGTIDHDFEISVNDNTAPRFVQEISVVSMFGGEEHIVEMDFTRIVNADGKAEDLRYHLEASGGNALPSWVKTDGNNVVIEPHEAVSGFYQFVLAATDKNGAEVRQEVTVYVSPPKKPSLEFSSGRVHLKSGEEFSFKLPPYAFSSPEGEKVTYAAVKSSGMTAYDTEAFRSLSELVWDELMRVTKYKEDFSDIPEESALRISGYLKAMDFLAGGDGSFKDFSHIKRELPYLDLALFDQELLSLRQLLPMDSVPMDQAKALMLSDRALSLSKIMNKENNESAKVAADKELKKIDDLLGIDTATIVKARDISYTSIENSTARAREAMNFLVKHIFEPVLQSGGATAGSEYDLNLSAQKRHQANAVFRMLKRNMNFGSDTPTIDGIADYDKKMIGGLMRSLDFLTGGDGKTFDLSHIVKLLPKENAQYGERYLKELSDLFEVEKVSISGIDDTVFSTVARLSAEYDAYLSLDSKTQSLHKDRMRELQYQIETVFQIRNSPTARLMQSSRQLDYRVLFASQAISPATLLSASLASLSADIMNQSGLNSFYGAQTTSHFSGS